jgi:serine phosphatase RsbU (regulator of sigma subunit)
MMPEATFAVQHTGFNPGDTLLLFTDGAFEGYDAAENWTADEVARTLANRVRSHPSSSAQELTDHLHAALAARRGAHFRADDTTFLIARHRS